jgi:threonine dehydrogenase-like Zn-dependent dehydrogenase
MKGIVFVGDREVEVRELSKPSPGAGEVLLAMKASGLCGSDLRAYRVPRAQRGDPTALAVGGHEPCGVVAEVGPGVSTVRVGDRVIPRWPGPAKKWLDLTSPRPLTLAWAGPRGLSR